MSNKNLINKVNKPKKIIHPRYSYMVTICPPDSADRIKKYFRTKQEADAFYQEQIKFIDSITPALDEVTASDIIAFRHAERHAKLLGMSMTEGCDLYVSLMNSILDAKLPPLLDTVKMYAMWRKENNCRLSLKYGITKYENYVTGATDRTTEAKNGILNFLKNFKTSFPLNIPMPLVTGKLLLNWILTRRRVKSKSGDVNTPLLPQTLHYYKYTISAMFGYFFECGFISRNPCENIDLPVVKLKDPEAYTPEAIRLAFRVFTDRPNIQLYIALAAFTGIRPAEIGRLFWSDVYIQDRVIKVSSEQSKVKTNRLVPIPDNLYEWLDSWKEHIGKPYKIFKSLNRVQYDFSKYYRRAGGKTIHDGFRHSCASYSLALGLDSDVVSHQLGHSPKTLKIYYLDLVRKEKAIEYFNIKPSNI